MQGTEEKNPLKGKKHIVLTGEMGVGKSTLVRRLLEEMQGWDVEAEVEMNANRNVDYSPKRGGFFTKRVEGSGDEEAWVHLSPAARVELYSAFERVYPAHQTVGLCHLEGNVTAFPEVFDTFGLKCLSDKDTELWVMDELGFIELEAHHFRKKVLELLSGDIPVIAVVKKKTNPFLEEVRHHPKVRVFEVTKENRERLFEEIMKQF